VRRALFDGGCCGERKTISRAHTTYVYMQALSAQREEKKQRNRAYGEAAAALFVCSFTLSEDFKQKSS
jgi:hypothetical protein